MLQLHSSTYKLSCFAHVCPYALTLCGRCRPGSGVMSDFFLFFFFLFFIFCVHVYVHIVLAISASAFDNSG